MHGKNSHLGNVQVVQIGMFVLRVDFSSAHISHQPRLQPRNSSKMSILAVQNSSSKTILYATLYSQPRKILIQATCSRAIPRP